MPCIAQVVGRTLTAVRTNWREQLDGVPAAAQQRHHHPQHDAQAVGLALGLDEGAQRGAQRGRRQRGRDQHERQRRPATAPVQLHHHDPETHQQEHLHQGGRHLAGDGAEQVGGFARGGGQQPAQGALLALVGEHGRDADQRDEHPGDQLPGRRIGARVVVDLILRWRPAADCDAVGRGVHLGLGRCKGGVEVGLARRADANGRMRSASATLAVGDVHRAADAADDGRDRPVRRPGR